MTELLPIDDYNDEFMFPNTQGTLKYIVPAIGVRDLGFGNSPVSCIV
ncbi:hypothetical protein [Chamaesiphon sp. VAR_48_metabat_135_sub]|nr:hypothetical protein [Chamaesiphon sp. VAR_48_metabat_135_sub]